jgi:hypothetical protein
MNSPLEEHTPETESIDRLFLELSQFTTARTKREMLLYRLNAELVEALNAMFYSDPEFDDKRLDYVTLQVDRLIYDDAKVLLKRAKGLQGPTPIETLAKDQVACPPEFSKLVTDHFDELTEEHDGKA